jgi:hypothetical protein
MRNGFTPIRQKTQSIFGKIYVTENPKRHFLKVVNQFLLHLLRFLWGLDFLFWAVTGLPIRGRSKGAGVSNSCISSPYPLAIFSSVSKPGLIFIPSS